MLTRIELDDAALSARCVELWKAIAETEALAMQVADELDRLVTERDNLRARRQTHVPNRGRRLIAAWG